MLCGGTSHDENLDDENFYTFNILGGKLGHADNFLDVTDIKA